MSVALRGKINEVSSAIVGVGGGWSNVGALLALMVNKKLALALACAGSVAVTVMIVGAGVATAGLPANVRVTGSKVIPPGNGNGLTV